MIQPLTRCFCLAALAWLVLAARPTPPLGAQPGGFHDLAVLVGGYQVFGQIAVGGEGRPPVVIATLWAADGATIRSRARVESVAGGSFEVAFATAGAAPRRPIRIHPGDRVTLAVQGTDEGGLAIPDLTLPVRPLAAIADPQVDAVSGFAPPGAALSVAAHTAGGERASLAAQADGSGRWSADFAGRLDIEAGTHGTALYFERDGTVYQAAWAVPAFSVAVGASSFAVRVRGGDVIRAVLTDRDGRVRGGAVVPAWTGTPEVRWRDSAGETVSMLPGDRLTVAFEPTGHPDLPDLPPMALALPPLSVRVDVDEDRVTGRTEPGRTVRLSLGDATGAVFEAIADARGDWRVDFAGTRDLTRETRVSVTRADEPNVHLQAYAASIATVDPFVASLTGRGSAGTPARMVVRDAAGRVRGEAAGRVDADGSFVLAALDEEAGGSTEVPGRSGEAGGAGSAKAIGSRRKARSEADGAAESVAPLPLAAGDRLEVTLGGWAQTIPHFPLDVRPDLGRDEVEGTGQPGARVTLTVDGAAPRSTDVDASGRWRLDLGEAADVRSGSAIDLWIDSPDGYRTAWAFNAFRASAQTNGDRVRIEGHPGLAARVELEREGHVVGTGACVVARAACTAILADIRGAPVRLAADDAVIVFPEGGSTATIDVFPLSAHIDPSGSDVVGLAPPNREVRIVFRHDQGAPVPFDTVIGTDEVGVYDHELSLSERGLMTPGLVADVFYRLPSGHQLWARGLLEVLDVTPGDAVLVGLAEPGAEILAHLVTIDGEHGCAAPARATGEATAAGDGAFQVTLRDAAGQPVAPVTGTSVCWSFRRGPRMVGRAVQVDPLAAWRLDAAGELVGVAPPGSSVQAYHHLRASPGTPAFTVVAGSADADGVFVLPPPAVDRSGVQAIDIVRQVGEGDRLRRRLDLGAAAGRAYLAVTRRD